MARRKKSTNQIIEESAVSAPLFDNAELKRISLCLGVLALRLGHHKFKQDKDRIPFLSNLGFDRHEIAAILDTTPLSVSVVLTNLKKKSNKKIKPNAENQSNPA
jgi:CRP-like cAMP-binding protein